MAKILHSKSTKVYAEKIAKLYSNVKLIDIKTLKKPKQINDKIIGIGGGKVVDWAKILAGNKKAIVYPTTAAGASSTSHAVYWDLENKKKTNIPTQIPETKFDFTFLKTLPKEVIRNTAYDALGHILDSYWSKNRTKESIRYSKLAYHRITLEIENDFSDLKSLIIGGSIAGRAIEITNTNMTHAISYPLTSFYNIPHGLAVGWAIPFCAKYQECDLKIPKINIDLNIDIKLIAKEAMKYPKIHDAIKNITEKELVRLLK